MTANFLQVKVSSNGMIGIHRKNSSTMLRPTEVQGLIQDLVYARKAVSRTSDPRIIDESAHLFNETSISMIKFKKTHNQSSSIYAQKMYSNTG